MRGAVRIVSAILLAAAFALPSARAYAQGAAEAEPERAPAFQGHAAEMRMRDAASEQRRRRLFFDAVDVEIGPQGLPCDHVARAKPEAVAGPGFVVLLTLRGEKPVLMRIWLPPAPSATAMTPTQALSEARALALRQRADAAIDSEEVQGFLWCR